MPSPVEIAVDTYIRASSERDPAVRAAMLEACFAEDGRMVTRSREIRGRAGLAAALTGFLADPQLLRIRVTSAIDARGTTFRYRAVAERRDGTSVESFDAGEIDGTGRISLLLTFAGPLGGLNDVEGSMTTAERLRREGRQEGKRDALALLFRERFGPLPASVRATIDNAEDAELDVWFRRSLSAASLEDVLEPPAAAPPNVKALCSKA
jgi:hypothetical protein